MDLGVTHGIGSEQPGTWNREIQEGPNSDLPGAPSFARGEEGGEGK